MPHSVSLLLYLINLPRIHRLNLMLYFLSVYSYMARNTCDTTQLLAYNLSFKCTKSTQLVLLLRIRNKKNPAQSTKLQLHLYRC